jgi:hypothetical protein
MAQVQPISPTPPAKPGAADAPLSQDDQLVSLLDAADADEAPPSTEEADEDADASPKEDEAPVEDQTEDVEEEPKDRLYEVRVDGVPLKVTLEEALAGYRRERTFHQRMQELGDQRKAFEAERAGDLAKLRETRGQYAQRLQALEQALTEEEPDWDAIRRDDPDSYPQRWADWQRRERRREQLAQERERVGEQEQEESAKQMQAHLVREQQKLHEFLPDLADRTKGPAIKADLLAAGEEYGYTPEEVESVVDHRAIRLLHDAAQYRKLLARKAALGKAPEGKTLTPGPKASVPSGTKARGAAYDRLKKTGSKEDAVAVFLGMLDDDERSTARKR